MKILSDSLKKVINSQNPQYIKKVELSKRIWSEAQSKYIFDTPIEISAKILEISPIKWKLDNEGYGIWNSAAASITISNYDNALGPDLPEENLQTLYGARVDFYGGSNTPQGRQYIKIFRGFALNTPIYDQSQKTLTLQLSGEIALLKNFSAEDISIKSEQEVLIKDTEDLSVLYTNQNTAGQIIDIWRGNTENDFSNARLLKAERDYKIENLNNTKGPAKIILSRPLSATQSCRADVRYWYTDKSADWIATQIANLTEAADTDIREMNFSSSETVENLFSQPFIQSFDEGTFRDIKQNDAGTAVQLSDTFPEKFKGEWEIIQQAPGIYFKEFSCDAIEILHNNYTFNGQFQAFRPGTHAFGTWENTVRVIDDQNERTWYHLTSTTTNLTTLQSYVVCQQKHNKYFIIGLYHMENYTVIQFGEAIVQFSTNMFEKVRYRITRDYDGNFYVWTKIADYPNENWTAKALMGNSLRYTTSIYQGPVMQISIPNRIEDFRDSPLIATGTGTICPNGDYYSPQIDGGVNLTSWNSFTSDITIPAAASASTAYRSRNTQEADWGEWQTIADGQTPNTSDRYLQLKCSLVSDVAQTQAPVLNNWSVSADSTGILIAVINMQGASCYSVLQEIAQMTGFQIGYDTEGKFLFRPRSSGQPLYSIGTNDILEIESISDNTERLYNRVTVNYGPYSRTVDSNTKNESRPNLIDKYGIKELRLSSGNLLPAQNSNIARAVAPEVYSKISSAKKTGVIITKFLPQIELDDIVNINYPSKLCRTMRVEGLETDLTNWTMRLDLTEV